MEDCIFCKIIRGEVPCAKIYEDDKVFAFLDVQPINPGHALVVPKRHHKDLFSLPEEFLNHCFSSLKKIASAVKKAVNADGIVIRMNNGKAAGQIVFHSHIHIVPRFLNDEAETWKSRNSYKEGEIEMWARRIKDEI